MLSGRGLCDELITRSEESYRLCCVVVCDLETLRIGAPYIDDIRSLRVKSDDTFFWGKGEKKSGWMDFRGLNPSGSIAGAQEVFDWLVGGGPL